jgi:hypothetical protein
MDLTGFSRNGAWAAGITDMPDLSTWPKDMRLIVRGERPHPVPNGASPTSTGCG